MEQQNKPNKNESSTAYIPKVLIVDLSKNFGGASARVLTLMQKYPPKRVFLAALKDSPVANYAMEKNQQVIIVGKKKYDFRIPVNLVKVIRAYGIDIIDVQNIQSKLWGSISASFSKARLVSTLNSWYLNEHQKTSLKGKIYTAIELLTNWSTPYYIVVSQKILDALVEAKINPDRVRLIYNAVEVKYINCLTDDIDIRNILNIPSNSTVCAALGRLVWAKGYEDLIHAFGLLKSKRPNLFCVIIGSGDLLSSLLEQITSSGLENRVFLLGQTDHVKALKILKSCDIFVMPSRTEGTPIALLEAASIGVPILATKVGGIPELLTDQDALLIPENSPTAIVDGLLKLTDDKEFAQALGRSAQKRVDNLFTVENQLDATLELYNKVLQN